MLYALIFAGFVAFALVAVFVWTAVRSAVRQLIENTARQDREARVLAFWTSVPEDAPVPVRLTGEDTGTDWVEFLEDNPVDPSHTPAGYAPDGLGVKPVKMSELRKRAY